MSDQKPSNAEEDLAMQYLLKHNIKPVLESLVTRIVQTKPHDPFAVLSNELSKYRIRPEVYFVLGGPGSGKGTQCSRLVNEHSDIAHLSAGDLLREERQSGSSTAQLIDHYIKEGKIVPVHITVGLLKKAMEKLVIEKGYKRFLVDGFPRNVDNLQGWRQVMTDFAHVKRVLFFDCPEHVMEQRLLERGKTSGRTDDNIDSIKKRFTTYVSETMPIIDEFTRDNLVVKVDAAQPIDHIFSQIRTVFISQHPDHSKHSSLHHAHSAHHQHKPHVVFVLGGPGAGKGTQCSKLVSEFGFCHLSAGDLLRSELQTGSETAKLIDHYIKEGKIVPVQITLGLLKAVIEKNLKAGTRHFLVDGFPRNMENLEGWQQVMSGFANVLAVLLFDCPEEVMEQRLLNRGKTSGRTDDNIESIKKRFRVYIDETSPIVKQLGEQGVPVHRIDATPEPDQVFQSLKPLISSLVK